MEGGNVGTFAWELSGTNTASIPQRENVCILIDVQPGMLEKYSGDSVRWQGMSRLDIALTGVLELIRGKAIFCSDDTVMIIFYNTAENIDAPLDMNGIHVLYGPGPATLDAIDLISSYRYESLCCRTITTLQSMRNIQNALCTYSLAMHAMQDTIQRVLICTYADQPEMLEDRHIDELHRNIEKIIIHNNIYLQLFLSEKFQLPLYLKRILIACQRHHKDMTNTTLFDCKRERDVTVTGVDFKDLITEKNAEMLSRYQIGTRLSMSPMNWYLDGEKGHIIHTSCSSTTHHVWPRVTGNANWLDYADSCLVVPNICPIQEQDDPQQIEHYYPKEMNTNRKKSILPKIYFSTDEVKQLREPMERGIYLIGFRPKNWLQDVWQVRESHWICLDESFLHLDLDRFSALHRAMRKKDVIALCLFVKLPKGEPRLACILPKTETGLDGERGVCFILIDLPFADDFRFPEKDDFLGKSAYHGKCSMPCPDEIARSKSDSKILVKNPHVHEHFSGLECFGLGRTLTI